MSPRVRTLREFDRSFKRLPQRVKEEALEKLARYLENPQHPSLRVKRVKASGRVWEMSVTMNYRITFEIVGETVILRRIGTHDILRSP